MTYHSDPARWTTSPGEAPELLRGGLEAAGREGPSDLQMRALALKLAAVGTGAALAAGAAGAKASATATGAGIAATGSSVLTKIAVSVALIGAAATGGTLLLRRPEAPSARQSAPVVAPVQQRELAQPAEVAQPELAQPAVAPKLEAPQVTERAPAVALEVAGLKVPVEQAAVEETRTQAAETAKAERRERRHARAEATERQAVSQPAVSSPEVVSVKGEKPQASEIDLLTKARAALAARPREAYKLTEEHKAAFPQGVFAQERDALAVEALQRSGDLEHARKLAEVFLKRYPSSPAAHRFRETMNLP